MHFSKTWQNISTPTYIRTYIAPAVHWRYMIGSLQRAAAALLSHCCGYNVLEEKSNELKPQTTQPIIRKMRRC